MSNPAAVLFFEPDEGLRNIVALTLRDSGLKVFEVANDSDAWKVLDMIAPDLILLNLIKESENLGKLIEAYRQQHNCTVVLTTTGRLESGWRNSYQPDEVIYKPYDVRYLRKKILMHLEMITGNLPVSKSTA